MGSIAPPARLFKRGLALLSGPSSVSMMSMALRVGGSLITLPLALRYVPSKELGLYYTFLSIIFLANLLDFGLGQTVARNCTYAFSGAKRFVPSGIPEVGEDKSPNFELLSLLTSTCKSYYYILGILLGLALVIGGGFFVRSQIVNEGLPTHLLGAWLLFAISTAHMFATGFWLNFLYGIGEVGLSARINLVTQLIGLVLMIACLFGGLGIWSYGIGITAHGVLSRHLSKAEYLKRVVAFPPGPWHEKKAILITMWPMAWRLGAVLVGVYLIQRFGVLLVTSKLGLVEAASYGLTLQVQSVIFQVCIVPLVIAMPHITRWRVQGDIPNIRKQFFLRTYLGLCAAVFILCGLGLFGDAALSLIGSNTPLLPLPVFALCAIFGLLEAHSVAHNHLILADNRNPLVLPVLISGVVSVGLGIFLVETMGVAGVVLASGLTQCAFYHGYVLYHGRKVLRIATPQATQASCPSA